MEKNILWNPVGKVCAFSGYRPSKMHFTSEDQPECLALKLRLKEEIYTAIEDGFTDFLCGMALGCDTWAAEELLDAKRTLQGIKEIHLHADRPCAGQDLRWSAKHRKRYHKILEDCTSITEVASHYVPDCMERRNQAMVHRADRLIAVFDGQKGGTKNTILLAHEKGIEIRILSPIPPEYHPKPQKQEQTEVQINLFSEEHLQE